jgi:hypothetical protein
MGANLSVRARLTTAAVHTPFPSWVKLRKAQSEHFESALTPMTGPNVAAGMEAASLYGRLGPVFRCEFPHNIAFQQLSHWALPM